MGVTHNEALRSLRTVLLEVLALVQVQGGEQMAQIARRLLQYVVNSMPPQLDEPSAYGGGVGSLKLPAVPAEVMEILLHRSSGCSAELLPCSQQLLRANLAAPAIAHRCLRLLLACDQLHKGSLPGTASFKRHLHSMLATQLSLQPGTLFADDENQSETSSESDSKVQAALMVHTAEMLLSSLA